jgi:hypothetical protein
VSRQKIRLGVTAAQRREVRLATGTDPVTDLGLPEVELSPAEPTLLVCMRVPATHVVGARKERCSRCRHKIWVAPSAPAHAELVCMGCFAEMTKHMELDQS